MSFQQIGDVAAAKVVNKWSWWRNALAGNFGPIHHEPEWGYYRTRAKDGQWEPVAIWQDDEGNWLAYRGGREVNADDVWTFCCREPIEYEAYEKAMRGEGFDDEPPAPIGHNSGDTDPFDAIRLELAGEAEMAEGFLKDEVKTQADADKAGIWAKRLGELAKRADKERETEKAPHLQACREVDDKWRPLIGDAKDLATKLKRHVEPYLIEQKRKRDEEARKAREEAERQRQAAMQAEDEEQRAAALKAAQDAEKAAEVKNASAGRTGARVSVRTEKRARVTDYRAAALALLDANHPELKEKIDQLAQRAVKAGIALAGVEVETVEKVV